MFHCQPQNCTMAQYFSQPFPKPGRNVFTLLWTTLYFQRHVHEAAANGHLKIVRYFHRLGADIEARDTEDRRPLWLAAQVGVTHWIRLPFLEFTWPTKILCCCDAFNSWSLVHPMSCQPHDVACTEPKQLVVGHGNQQDLLTPRPCRRWSCRPMPMHFRSLSASHPTLPHPPLTPCPWTCSLWPGWAGMSYSKTFLLYCSLIHQ